MVTGVLRETAENFNNDTVSRIHRPRIEHTRMNFLKLGHSPIA
jgi:hypothetical protein